jgi:aspartyl protease family protein
VVGWLALVLLVVAALAIVLGGDGGALFGWTATQFAAAAFAMAIFVIGAAPLLRRYQGRLGLAARDVLMWAGVVAGLGLTYVYRSELPRVVEAMVAAVAPSDSSIGVPEPVESERLVRLRRQSGGHFIARAAINGGTVSVVVDTGATAIVLKPDDAEQAGIDLGGLAYSVPVETANGAAFAAPIRLKSVVIGPVGLANVDALVAKPGTLDYSLLGMSFLSRIKSYEFSGDFLTLRG